MRKKATYKKAASSGVNTFPAKDSAGLTVITETTPTGGKGLGKAGARRLGRLLKRATQNQEAAGEEKASLPRTPVRLFKHFIQTAAENLPRTHTAKPNLPQDPHFLLGVVSQFKLQGGISMAELRQLLAAGGFDVTQNNRQVNQELLKKETTRTSSSRPNNTIQTKQVRISSVESPNSKTNLRQRACTSSKGAETLKRQAKRTPISKRQTLRQETKKHKLTLKTRNAAAKARKPRRKKPQPKGKKSRSTTKQAARVQKVQRTKRRPHQTLQKRQPPRRRQRFKKRQRARRKAGYY
ncbi:uncharacterized protein AB9W97_016735 isoform 1-T2 [Spinachia spinachia]